MSKKLLIAIFIVIALILAACGGNETEEGTDELKELKVDFEVPETVQVDETVELKATVTYGDEPVEDADEVVFELWEQGNEEESIKIEGTHVENGMYTAETTFEKAGVYEMYAHTTARDLHTMPKKEVTVE